jgi:hypothetical protein
MLQVGKIRIEEEEEEEEDCVHHLPHATFY